MFLLSFNFCVYYDDCIPNSLQFLYFDVLLDFLDQFCSSSDLFEKFVKSKMADPRWPEHFEMCDFILAFCDVVIDT